jgi:hypothetical protein
MLAVHCDVEIVVSYLSSDTLLSFHVDLSD